MHRTNRTRTTQPILALLAAAVATLAALVATRPHLSGGPASWNGDDLAVACLWWGAVATSAWLAVTTMACVAALARGRTRAAHRFASWAPPLARRLLQAALVSTWALVPSVASAAPPSAPVTVYVGAGGRLVPAPRGHAGIRARAAGDVPVVRTPATTAASKPPTTAAPATLPVTAGPATTLPSPAHPHEARHQVVHQPAAPRAPERARTHVVRAGDNLWRIARAEVIRTTGVADPDDAPVARYWQLVIAANRTTLRSGDPSLIFPGEVVALPAATD